MYSASCWYYLSDWLISCYFTSHPNYFNIARRYIPYWTMMMQLLHLEKYWCYFTSPPPIKKNPQKTHKNSKQPAHILNNDHRKCVTITFYKMYIYIYSLLWSEICHVLLQKRLTLLYGRHAQQVNPNTTMAYIWTYILIVTRSDMT